MKLIVPLWSGLPPANLKSIGIHFRGYSLFNRARNGSIEKQNGVISYSFEVGPISFGL